jgi:hypothetical protein
VAGLPEENTEYTYWVSPTCTAGTAATSYTTTAVGINTCMLWRAEFRIPPGHSGFTGIALWDSGAFIIPFANPGPAWLIGDNDLLEYPYGKELGANVKLATYNTGIYNHSWQVRLIYTPMSALVTEGDVIISPDVTDWLSQVEASS